jgi:hypothetical protein
MQLSKPKTQTQQKRLYRSLSSLAETENLLPAFVYASIGFQLLLFFWLGFLGVGVWRISHRPVPSLVQLVDGRSVRVKPASSLERTPQSIRDFVGQISALLFNWSLAESKKGDKAKEPFVSLSDENELKVTTSTWEGGFALSDDFRQSFLEALAKRIPQSIWSAQAQSVLEVLHLSEPEPLEPGQWKVTQIANLHLYGGRNATAQIIPFNHEFYVRSIDTPPLPLPEAATPLQRTVYRIREVNLEIYDIKSIGATDNERE